MSKFNLMLNLATSLLIFCISVVAIAKEKYVSPQNIYLEKIEYLQNTKTRSAKSRDSLLIPLNTTTYRSSCLGLAAFCSQGQETQFKQPVHIQFLLVQNKPQPEGIILKITNSTNHEIIFQNDVKHINRYLNGVRNVKWMEYGISFVSLFYLVFYMMKWGQFKR